MSYYSTEADTTNWNVMQGGSCRCCGGSVKGRLTVTLGSERPHRMELKRARGLAQAIIEEADRMEGVDAAADDIRRWANIIIDKAGLDGIANDEDVEVHARDLFNLGHALGRSFR